MTSDNTYLPEVTFPLSTRSVAALRRGNRGIARCRSPAADMSCKRRYVRRRPYGRIISERTSSTFETLFASHMRTLRTRLQMGLVLQIRRDQETCLRQCLRTVSRATYGWRDCGSEFTDRRARRVSWRCPDAGGACLRRTSASRARMPYRTRTWRKGGCATTRACAAAARAPQLGATMWPTSSPLRRTPSTTPSSRTSSLFTKSKVGLSGRVVGRSCGDA